MLGTEKIRQDFRILSRRFKNRLLAYLDNAATTQKPWQVLAAMDDYYATSNANVNRGAYQIAAEATETYEQSRKKVAKFIGAGADEIIFTKNATESLNLVASAALQEKAPGSRILLTQMEHHSNIVPWQLAAQRNRMRVEYAAVRSNGTLCSSDIDEKLSSSPAIFSFTHVSNVLGTINNAKELAKKAKKAGALVCVDAAQSVPHMKVDVKEIGCDFLAFSGHKMLGPTGIGVLYMRRQLQEALPPFLGGGDMIKSVGFEGSAWNLPPHKFEAGTPNVAGAAGLAAAIGYLERLGMSRVSSHGKALAAHCREALSGIDGVRFYGPQQGAGLVSFNIGKIHAHDLATFADREAVAIRTGHHCAQPLMKLLGEPATARASFYVYNNEEEIERLAATMKKAQKKLGSTTHA